MTRSKRPIADFAHGLVGTALLGGCATYSGDHKHMTQSRFWLAEHSLTFRLQKI